LHLSNFISHNLVFSLMSGDDLIEVLVSIGDVDGYVLDVSGVVVGDVVDLLDVFLIHLSLLIL